MNKFTFYWLTGKREVLEGDKPLQALNDTGYGGGAVRALDFYAEGDNKEYVWDKENREWELTPEARKEKFG